MGLTRRKLKKTEKVRQKLNKNGSRSESASINCSRVKSGIASVDANENGIPRGDL